MQCPAEVRTRVADAGAGPDLELDHIYKTYEYVDSTISFWKGEY